MKNKMVKTLVACVLSTACVLTACGTAAEPIADVGEEKSADAGNEESTDAGNEESADAGNEEEAAGNVSSDVPTLTYFCGSLGDSNIQSYNENVMYQEVEKNLGINLEFQHSTRDGFGEQLGVMIASSDLPDIIEGFSYAKGPEAAIEDGLILSLNDLVDQYAPDFKALLEADPELKRQTVLDDGTIWCIPCLEPNGEKAWRGFSIRKDLLDKAGLEVPTCLPELEEAMKALKDMGVTYPISIQINWSNPGNSAVVGDGYLIGAFDIAGEWYLDLETREPKYGPLEDRFKDFLEMMHRWYEEGLLDPEFNTRSGEDFNAMIANGEIGVFVNGYGPTLNSQTSGAAVNPEFQLEQMPNLPLEKGGETHIRNFDAMNKGNETVITTSCDNPEAAMKFLNYGFTEEGTMLYNYGVEGISYEMVDGEPQWTERITSGEEGSWVQIREKYKKHTGPYKRYAEAFPCSDFETHCMEVWDQGATDLIFPKKITRTAEENEIFGPIMNDVRIYLSENVTAFINGSRSLDEFDQFREELKGFGIEKAHEITVAAYERYLNRE